ncbi:MAG: hypothetical protein HDR72_01870 [Ruminococcaceae bacterium]|nr:hypothetical protein [Oscillospiraceae bacterium]
MTCEEIFSKIANIYLNGIMYHTEMVQYFDFLNLHGYKRMHEYHRKCESEHSRKLHGYYTNRYQKLLPETGEYAKSAIPRDWYGYKRSEVTSADVKKGVKAAFEKWVEWERSVCAILNEAIKELGEHNDYAAACEIGMQLRDTEDELKRAERMLLTLKSVDFSIDFIQEQQCELHKKYKKKAEKV